MIALLSPAKTLRTLEAPPTERFTHPALEEHVQELLEVTRPLSAGRLQELMHISADLGQLNQERFQSIGFPFTPENAHPAVFAFYGDVYRGLEAETLSEADLEWSQEHLVILSGLYGMLRPLDLMQPYRLEMGTRLENPRGKNLYAFWKQVIAPRLSEQLDAQGDRVVLNLASNEYFKAVNKKLLGARIITPVFKDTKDGKTRIISFYAKTARGAMARWFVENRVTDPAAVQDAEVMGYRFDPDLSEGDQWVFTRLQPPPKS
ncbi:MAG: peroxide stress protein YaaA [Myxococcota bacterium]|nr:peroxide stress protein YaaA [Myxococcota bacterium]